MYILIKTYFIKDLKKTDFNTEKLEEEKNEAADGRTPAA